MLSIFISKIWRKIKSIPMRLVNYFYYTGRPKDFSPFIDFIFLKRGEKIIQGFPSSYYRDLPQIDYDYIFIDGPTFRKDKRSPKCFNADLINIIKKNKSIIINRIIDQRILNYIIFKKLLPDADIKYNVIKKLGFINSVSHQDLDLEKN